MGSRDLTLVPATAEHVEELARRMRPADEAEVLAADGLGLRDSVRLAAEWSDPGTVSAGLAGGELACICGVVRGPFVTGVAYPWLLTTGTVDRHRAAFLRASRAVLARWLARYPHLEQHIDARYAQALRWVAWLGFTVYPPEPYGVARLPFHRVQLKREDVHV